MVVRMVEYDFAIAFEEMLNAGTPYEMNFPESCVLFLRHTSSTPDELEIQVNLLDEQSVRYTTRVVKAQRFSSDELFEKRLLLLLPYCLMRYEGALAEIESDERRTTELIAECAELRNDLDKYALAFSKEASAPRRSRVRRQRRSRTSRGSAMPSAAKYGYRDAGR